MYIYIYETGGFPAARLQNLEKHIHYSIARVRHSYIYKMLKRTAAALWESMV